MINLHKLCLLSVLFLLIVSSIGFSQSSYFINESGELQEIICGDGVCSVGQNAQNCPIDCLGTTFDVWVETQDIYVLLNEEFTQLLTIKSHLPNQTNYVIQSLNSQAVSINPDSVRIQNQSSRTVELVFKSNKTQSIYQDEIEIRNNRESKTIPFTIHTITSHQSSITPRLQLLSSTIQYNKPFTFRATANIPSQYDNVTILILLKDTKNNSYTVAEFVDFQKKRFDYTESIVLKDITNKSSLEYTLLIQVYHIQQVASTTQFIQVQESFFHSWYFRTLIIVLVGLPLLYFIVKFALYIRKKRLGKKRYVQPNYSLLPGKKANETFLEVGLLADTKRQAYLQASDLTTHALVAGSTGSGKSVTASIIVEEALNKKIPAVIFDPTAQWTGFLSGLKDPNILRYYSDFSLSKDDTRSYKGLIFTPKNDTFDLDFQEYMNPGEVTVFNLSNLSVQEYDSSVKKIIDSMFQKKWEESGDLKLVVVFDEVHRLLDKNAKGEGYAALTKACREFRKWGIGLVMASQVSSDFKEAIGGNVLTEVQLNTKNLEDIKKIAKKYGGEYAQRITRQGIGVALVQNPKYNKGKPWFIHFRPPLHNPHKLSEDDLTLYEKFTNILKDVKQQLDSFSEDDDIEDMKMDYHLAISKLKEGKFKMAEIYIQNLQDELKKRSA